MNYRAPEYKGITIGASVLFVCAMASAIAACVCLGLCLATIGKTGGSSPEALMQLLYCVALFGYAAILGMMGSVALAVRDAKLVPINTALVRADQLAQHSFDTLQHREIG